MTDRVHALKTLPRYYAAMADGTKTFEVRRDDRAYAEGDVLRLREFDPTLCDCTARECSKRFTGRELRFAVTYVLPGGQFGIDPDYVVLGLSRLDEVNL